MPVISKDVDIYFYNNYHNGDVFYSKEFVKDIKNKTGKTHFYIHNNNPVILKDVDIKQIQAPTPSNISTVSKKDNDVYINTWIGQGGKYNKFSCSLKSNYLLFQDVYKILGIDIEPIGFYIPDVDFDKVDKVNTDKYFEKNKNKTVLICNNNVLSGQAVNFNFDAIIKHMSNVFSDTTFIFTNNTQLVGDNITTANNIIGYDKGNLLEISYLSTKIDTIIGRASGPFCFSHIKENMKDENKKFIVFSNEEDEGKWVPDSESTAKQHWFNRYDKQYVIDSIEKTIKINE